MKFGIGQSVLRKEDHRLVTGRGRFVEDLKTSNTLALHVVRAPVAHAKIMSIDSSEAAAAAGVHAVLTGANLVSDGIGGMTCSTILPHIHQNLNAQPTPALASDKILFVGMPLALVIADTKAIAEDAAELLDIDFENLEPILTPAQALANDAPSLWPDLPNNIAFEIKLGDKTKTEEAIANAAHVTHMKLHNNRLSANPMEMRGGLASFDTRDGRVTLHTSTQAPHTVRASVATALNMPQGQLRVVAEDVGGGFGMKGGLYPEDILLAWVARKLQCPVAWNPSRSESLLSDYHGRDQWVEAELAFDSAGKVAALRIHSDYNAGAYLSPGGGVSPMFSSTLATGCYAVPTAYVHSRAIYTNTSPTQPYRGAGRPEAAYLIEQLMDKAAREIGIDRLAIRRANMIAADAMPYKTPLVYTIDSGDYATILNEAVLTADWDGAEKRKADAKARGKLHGIGLALHMENAGLANDSAEIRFDADGSVSVLAGTFSHGQGHETVYAQMVSQWLGVPFDNIRLIQGDTDSVAFGRGTVASRSMVNGGASLRIAADKVINKAKAIASHLMEVAAEDLILEEGHIVVSGTDKKMSLQHIAAMSFRPILPPELGIGLSGKGDFLLQGFTFPNGCQIVELEIDPETGVTDILNIVSVDDVGTVINPMLLDGQLMGGIAQGLGQAVMESVIYDEEGQLLTGSFMDYAMPRAEDMPPRQIELQATHTDTNPLGVKGAGEAGTVGATPAIISAFIDALAPMGIKEVSLPATPNKIWTALQTGQS